MSKYPLGFYIKSINNMMEKQLNIFLDKFDITNTQLNIALYIMNKNRLNELVVGRDIEKEFNISNPTLVGILNRLEKKGYIERKVAEDARYKNIIVTDKFLKIKEYSMDLIEKNKNIIYKDFTDDEKETLINLIDKLYKNIGGER